MLNLLKYLRDRFSSSKNEEKEPEIKKLKGYTPEEMFGKEEGIKNILEDFEKASKYLAVRIYQEDFMASFKLEELVHRKDLEGTVTVLVLDLPDSVESVLNVNIEKWRKLPEELFVLAFDNLKEKFKRETEKMDNNFIKLSGDDIFITSEILFFERNKDCIGKFGAIVCLPNRNTLMAVPINSDLDVEVGLQLMIPFAENTFDHSEDSAITRHIFWHYAGRNELIYTYYGLNRLKYVLPADLADLVY
ncbi:MAG TPA: hypothetical protein VK766_02570 [Cytophagaceae bacterium]|jgi:hypothetical protein|nr:hypothetical protein [Cytophagaceae bacterium]